MLSVDSAAIATQTMSYSGSGVITNGNVIPVDPDRRIGNASTSSCEVEDFVGPDWSGSADIALIQRSACAFGIKEIWAQTEDAE